MTGKLDIIFEDFLHILHSKPINRFFGLLLRIHKTKVSKKNVEKCEIILLPMQYTHQIYQIGLREIKYGFTEIYYCKADFLVIILVDIWKGAKCKLALGDKIDKLLQISTIKQIRLFNFDLWMLIIFYSISKYRDCDNDILCENLFINITKVIINFIIIIEITTI